MEDLYILIGSAVAVALMVAVAAWARIARPIAALDPDSARTLLAAEFPDHAPTRTWIAADGAGLIARAGGDPKAALQATEQALNAIPKVSGGSGQLHLVQPTAKVFDTAEKIAKKAGDSFVTVERLLLALAMEKEAKTAEILARAGVTPQT
ncbi:MAG TPA: Clp protease N-terminal domain-containing protein, partial [Caulobacter sp.]|nr:Clp protease N-terminal domain-containing protein [Caulobacter sp.]